MNRRDFIMAGGALALGAQLPAFAAPANDGACQAAFDGLVDYFMAIEKDGYYVLFMHPQQHDDLLKLEARSAWYYAWRRYRIARRESLCGWLPPRTVFERFKSPPMPHVEVKELMGMDIVRSAA